MNTSFQQLADTRICYLPRLRTSYHVIYLAVIIAIAAALIASRFLYTDIFTRADGVIRPSTERAEIRAVVGGIIDSLLVKEGDIIHEGQTMVKIKDLQYAGRLKALDSEMEEYRRYLHDLRLLTGKEAQAASLRSKVYSDQLGRHLSIQKEKRGVLDKLALELQVDTKLAEEKIISPKEFYDAGHRHRQAIDGYESFLREQQVAWQQDLAKYQLAVSQLESQRKQVLADASLLTIRAATSGVVQGVNDLYTGSYLQAGQLICTVSPENGLVGECYVKSRDVGLLYQGQPVRYQLEAFNYNYFGEMTGKVMSIDKDLSLLNNTPVIKLRCSFDSTVVHLKNGYTGRLRKGLNFQASFFIARRSCWQLLFDKLDDWFNPQRPVQNEPDETRG